MSFTISTVQRVVLQFPVPKKSFFPKVSALLPIDGHPSSFSNSTTSSINQSINLTIEGWRMAALRCALKMLRYFNGLMNRCGRNYVVIGNTPVLLFLFLEVEVLEVIGLVSWCRRQSFWKPLFVVDLALRKPS
jgi:hypothetical protein